MVTKRGAGRASRRIAAGLGFWLLLQSASCGETDRRLCEAMDVTGQWELNGESSFRISGTQNDVVATWSRGSLFSDEEEVLDMLMWPADRDEFRREIVFGEGETIQDPADNISPETGLTKVYVAGPSKDCWLRFPEARCQLHYRLRLTGTAGSSQMRGAVEVWRISWAFFVGEISEEVRDFVVTVTRNQPLVRKETCGVVTTSTGTADGGTETSGSGGGCGGGTYRSSGDGGDDGWSTSSSSSSGGWWEETSSTSSSSSSSGMVGNDDDGGTPEESTSAGSSSGEVGFSSSSSGSGGGTTSSSGGEAHDAGTEDASPDVDAGEPEDAAVRDGSVDDAG
ncbi:MAG: hypothetical protein AB2A00_16010 [Myxococcota bacterium]